MISYLAEPDVITAITDTLDLDNTLHKYVEEYVKAEFYLDAAGKAIMDGENDKSVLLDRQSDKHKRIAKDELEKQGMKKRDKIGGLRQLVTRDFR